MGAFKLDKFSGLLPRIPASLLPQGNATLAENCEFAYGELRNTKDGFNISAFSNSPQSIYTEDGLRFFSWPFDVDAARSPLSNDTFDRMYFTTPTDFRVTQRSGMSTTGGQPGTSYRVGVPQPAVAPTMAVATAPALSTATLTATFHYEYSGVKYQEQTISLAPVTPYEKWTFTAPAPDTVSTTVGGVTTTTGTPVGAFPVVNLTAIDAVSSAGIFDIYTSNSGLFVSTDWILTIGSTTGTAYTLDLASTVTERDKETRAYLYTYVNVYGEEGPPSPPGTVTTTGTLTVTVGVKKDIPAADYAPIKEIRIYRTPTGTEVADYFYVGTIAVLSAPGSAFSFADNVKASGLNEPLASAEYYPPDVALTGLMSLPNGILCAWKGNELHFSDAYKPWSWPPSYRKTFTHAIVGGIVSGSGALITTLASPFLISGVSPDSMTETKIKAQQAGISKWAMADIGGMLLYASNDGIVAVQGNQAVMDYSEQFFTRDVWRAAYRAGFSSMRFAVWDGRLVVYSSAASFRPFMIRLDEARGQMTDIPQFVAACTFTSPVSDQCYYIIGNQLYQFAGGTDATARWMSSEFNLRVPGNFGAAQALVEGSWTIDFWAQQTVNGVDQMKLMFTQQVTTGQTNFRLLAGFLSDRWQIKLTGTGRFRELRVGNTPKDMKDI